MVLLTEINNRFERVLSPSQFIETHGLSGNEAAESEEKMRGLRNALRDEQRQQYYQYALQKERDGLEAFKCFEFVDSFVPLENLSERGDLTTSYLDAAFVTDNTMFDRDDDAMSVTSVMTNRLQVFFDLVDEGKTMVFVMVFVG